METGASKISLIHKIAVQLRTAFERNHRYLFSFWYSYYYLLPQFATCNLSDIISYNDLFISLYFFTCITLYSVLNTSGPKFGINSSPLTRNWSTFTRVIKRVSAVLSRFLVFFSFLCRITEFFLGKWLGLFLIIFPSEWLLNVPL